VKAWLTSGVMEDGIYQKIESGTPQGGVISPLLANIALHGMETEVRKCVNKNKVAQMELNFIRYADDFVVMHKDKEVILKCKNAINQWLSDIGLELKPEKTRLTHTLEPELSEDNNAGFDFLGFHIQQHKAGKHKCSKNLHRKLTGYITLITPSKKSQKNHQEKLGEIIGKLVSKPIESLIKQLNPVIKGWSNYYQYSDIKSTGISSKQDNLMYSKLRSWAKRTCDTVKDGLDRYYHNRNYTMLNGIKSQRKEWADSTTAIGSITYHGDIHCSSTEYVKIRGNKSPFDGDLKYWSKRLQSHPELSTRKLNLLKRQKCRCAECGLYFVEGDIMEVDHIIPLSLGGKDKYDNLQLLHGHCHDRKTARDGSCTKKPNQVDNSKDKPIKGNKSYKPDKLDLIAIERNSPDSRNKKSQDKIG
jgi:RNA-directed DNA polymerase